jgi:hypothetical protein
METNNSKIYYCQFVEINQSFKCVSTTKRFLNYKKLHIHEYTNKFSDHI